MNQRLIFLSLAERSLKGEEVGRVHTGLARDFLEKSTAFDFIAEIAKSKL